MAVMCDSLHFALTKFLKLVDLTKLNAQPDAPAGFVAWFHSLKKRLN
jgi:hypothetical protein